MSVTRDDFERVLESFEGLREDQREAMACLGRLIEEIKASPKPLAMAASGRKA